MPYLKEDVRLYVNPKIILGRAGDQVTIVSRSGHVLIVKNTAENTSPYSITTKNLVTEPSGRVDDKSIDNNQNLQKENSSPYSITTNQAPVKPGAFNAKRHDSNTTGMERYSQRTEGKRSKSSKRTPKNSQTQAVPGQSLSLFG